MPPIHRLFKNFAKFDLAIYSRIFVPGLGPFLENGSLRFTESDDKWHGFLFVSFFWQMRRLGIMSLILGNFLDVCPRSCKNLQTKGQQVSFYAIGSNLEGIKADYAELSRSGSCDIVLIWP